MTDDQQLARRIAQALGYHVEVRKYNGVAYWYLDRPDEPGQLPLITVRWGETSEHTEDDAWRMAIANQLPEWLTTLDDAITLPVDSESWIELHGPGWNSDKWACRIETHIVPPAYPAPLTFSGARFKEATTPALAVCKAWLAYHEWVTSNSPA